MSDKDYSQMQLITSSIKHWSFIFSLLLIIASVIIIVIMKNKSKKSIYFNLIYKEYLFIIITVGIIFTLYKSSYILEHQILGIIEIFLTGFFAYGEITLLQWTMMETVSSVICILLLLLIIFLCYRIILKVKNHLRY